MKEAVNSVVNLLTYMALGVMLIIFGISMYHMASPYEVLIFFGAFLGLLLLAIIVGYTGNRAFPNFEMERYRVFFFCIETVGIILIGCIGIALRLEAIEKHGIIYDNWDFYNSAKMVLGSKMLPLPEFIAGLYNTKPGLFFYSITAALAVYIYDAGNITLLYVQLILQVLFSIFSYRVARKVSGRLAGLITFSVMMCMPSLVASVGFVYEYLPGLVVIFLQMWIFFSLQKRKNAMLKNSLKFVLYSIDGILLAVAIFAMPDNVIVFVGEVIYIVLLNVHAKKHIVSFISLVYSTVLSFLVLIYAKSIYLGISFEKCINGFASYYYTGGTGGVSGDMRFMSENLTLCYSLDNYADKFLLHNLPMENATIYGNLILMSVICLIFLWTQGERAYFVLHLYFLISFAYGAAFTHENIYHIIIMPYLAILTGVLFEKIYVSFKVEPKRITKMVKQLSELSLRKENVNVIDLNKDNSIIGNIEKTDKDDEREPRIKEKEDKDISEDMGVPTLEKLLGAKKATENEPDGKEDIEKPLENPLPIPKKNKKDELDYDIDISEDADFDI